MTNNALQKGHLRTMTEIDKIRQRFENDRFATNQTDIKIDEAHENYSKCSFEIQTHHLNGIDKVMGGAIFTIADFATAVAANGVDKKSVSLSNTINFLGQPKGKTVIAEAKIVKSGKTVSVFEVNVYDELNTPVAFVTSTIFNM